MAHAPEQFDPPDETLPAALAEAIRQADSAHIFVPPAVDALILSAAAAHLAPIRRSRRARFVAAWTGVAAACLAAAVTVWSLHQTYAPADLNHDGRVDILDAFALARSLNAGESEPALRDFNHDGRVDSADVEFLARQAVALPGGRG